jgi:hypothetical protein
MVEFLLCKPLAQTLVPPSQKKKIPVIYIYNIMISGYVGWGKLTGLLKMVRPTGDVRIFLSKCFYDKFWIIKGNNGDDDS